MAVALFYFIFYFKIFFFFLPSSSSFLMHEKKKANRSALNFSFTFTLPRFRKLPNSQRNSKVRPESQVPPPAPCISSPFKKERLTRVALLAAAAPSEEERRRMRGRG